MTGVWLLLVGCGGGGVEGRVVDGLTKAPIPGPYNVVAKATTEAGMGCQIASAPVGADGTFSIASACSGVAYDLTVDKDELWLADAPKVPEAGVEGPMELVAWPAPKASGLYAMKGTGEFEALKTAADVKSDRIMGSDERVKYPSETVPANVPLLEAGQRLVLVGSAVDEFTFEPLVVSGPRWFAKGKTKGPEDAKEKYRMPPWNYLGTSFTDDTTFARVAAVPDPAKVVEKKVGTRAAKWIAVDALPPGRYALMKEGDRRMYLVDFGQRPPPLPADPEPPVIIQLP